MRDRVDDGLALVDLHLTFADLRRLAVDEATAGHWLDALLLAAGAGQVLDDHLHHSKTWPKRLHELLQHGDRPPAVGLRRGLDLAGAARSRRPGDRSRIRAREALYALTVDLAARLGLAVDDDLADRLATVLADDGPWTPTMEDTVLSSRPASAASTSTRRTSSRWPGSWPTSTRIGASGRGVSASGPRARTSGRCSPPRSARRASPTWSSSAVRPDDHLDHAQRATVRSARLRAARGRPAGERGVPGRERRPAGRCRPGGDRAATANVPPALAERPVVRLAVEDWHLPTLLAEDHVRGVLQDLLGSDVDVVSLTPVPWPGPWGPVAPSTDHRDHRRAAFAVDLLDDGPRTRTLLVESTGQGVFGRHNRAVALALPGRVPESIGFVDGIHLQWLPDAVAADVTADAVVDHLVARHEALAVDHDPTEDFEGRQCVVEVATEILADALGPAGPPARLRVVATPVRRRAGPPRPWSWTAVSRSTGSCPATAGW